jgi:segregation and condensation protein B
MEQRDEDDERAPALKLGESYAALLGQKEWQIDVPDEIPLAEEAEEPPLAEPVEEVKLEEPPLAEAANETTIPPAPLQIVEALLFVGGIPLKAEHVREVIRGFNAEQLTECIEALNKVYQQQNRPYMVMTASDGYVMRLKSRFTSLREKLYGGPREARLNPTALDVLSLVAYRQPIPKATVDTIRGSDSGGILRQLVRLGLIAGEPNEAKELAYSTTDRFLEIFRLKSLEDLPQLGQTRRI